MKKEITYNTESSAVLTAKSYGATKFEGSTENCGILRFCDNNGDRMGHIYASYNQDYQKVYRVRYNHSSN
jgi:hypothetical protein